MQCGAGADIQPLHGKVGAGTQGLLCAALPLRDGERPTGACRRRRIVQHRRRPLQVQGPQIPRRVPALVVIHPEGGVRVLLDLRYKDAGADGVDGAGLDEKRIALLHRHAVQYLTDGAVRRPPPELLRRELPREAEVDGGVRAAVHDIPHLCLTRLASVPKCRPVGRMHLNGQVFLGVDELDQQRECLHSGAAAPPEGSLIPFRQLLQRLSRQRPALHRGDALRPLGQLPALRRDVRRIRFVIVRPQTVATPEIFLIARVQLQRHQLHKYGSSPYFCTRTIPLSSLNDKSAGVSYPYPPQNICFAPRFPAGCML